MKLLGFSILCCIWGTTWLAIKISLEGLPPFFSAGVRFALALLLLFVIIMGKKIPLRLPKKQFKLVVLTAFLTYAIDYGFIYWGEQYLSAGVTAIFFATLAIFTAIFANFIFKNEHFHARRFVGLLLGFAGIVVVFYDQLALTNFDRLVLLGSLAVIIAAASAALSIVIVKKHLTSVNPFVLTFYQLLGGVCFLFAISVSLEEHTSLFINGRIALAIAYLGIMGTAFAFVLYYRLLQEMSAITLALIIYITPIIAVITDVIAFGEIIPLRSLLGMCIIFLGIGFTQRKKRPGPIVAAEVAAADGASEKN